MRPDAGFSPFAFLPKTDMCVGFFHIPKWRKMAHYHEYKRTNEPKQAHPGLPWDLHFVWVTQFTCDCLKSTWVDLDSLHTWRLIAGFTCSGGQVRQLLYMVCFYVARFTATAEKTEVWTKWLPFLRRHFKMHVLEWKWLLFFEYVPWGLGASIGLGNVLVSSGP